MLDGAGLVQLPGGLLSGGQEAGRSGMTLARVTRPHRGFAGERPLLRFTSRCFWERRLTARLPGQKCRLGQRGAWRWGERAWKAAQGWQPACVPGSVGRLSPPGGCGSHPAPAGRETEAGA